MILTPEVSGVFKSQSEALCREIRDPSDKAFYTRRPISADPSLHATQLTTGRRGMTVPSSINSVRGEGGCHAFSPPF